MVPVVVDYAPSLICCIPTAPYNLVYFEQDKIIFLASATVVAEVGSVMEPSCSFHVKEKEKIYEGRIVTYGKYVYQKSCQLYMYICFTHLICSETDVVNSAGLSSPPGLSSTHC